MFRPSICVCFVFRFSEPSPTLTPNQANDEIDDGNDGRSIGTLVLAGLLLLSTILYVLAIAFSSFRLMRLLVLGWCGRTTN